MIEYRKGMTVAELRAEIDAAKVVAQSSWDGTIWISSEPPHGAPPRMTTPHDWERDPRPLSECLAEWERELNGGRVTGARAAGARALRVPPTTYAGWRAGRVPQHEAMVRRLMSVTSP